MAQTGPGGASAFVLAWQAWRAHAERCRQLHVIWIDSHLPDRLHAGVLAMDGLPANLVAALTEAWPPITPGLHRLGFDGGRIQLLVARGEPTAWLRNLVAEVDAFSIFTPSDLPDPLSQEPRLAKALARLARPDATLVASSFGDVARQSLKAAGFRLDGGTVSAERLGDDLAISGDVSRAHYAPLFTPRRAGPPKSDRRPRDKHVLIIGGGLAGCATAWALAEQGWHSSLLERHSSIAREGSGNIAGLFHGIVNGQDSTHARFNRAAALEAGVAVGLAIARHGVPGAHHGLLQLANPPNTVAAMRALLQRLHLPKGYVKAVDAREASTLAGLHVQTPGWFYPGGGWVQPGGLARSFLERAPGRVELRCGEAVARLRRQGECWQLLDADDQLIGSAATVVLANAGDALQLLGGAWPVDKVRGQISLLADVGAAGVRLPILPMTGAGYVLPEVDGHLVFGATTQVGDDDATVRPSDHADNIAQLARLAPDLGSAAEAGRERLSGRTSWRWTSRDRLPMIGAAPCFLDSSALSGGTAAGPDGLGWVPRQPGLFVYTALGSRGITWAALGAQVLAAMITGAPAPIEAKLLDAVDPARFMVRSSRRMGTGGDKNSKLEEAPPKPEETPR